MTTKATGIIGAFLLELSALEMLSTAVTPANRGRFAGLNSLVDYVFRRKVVDSLRGGDEWAEAVWAAWQSGLVLEQISGHRQPSAPILWQWRLTDVAEGGDRADGPARAKALLWSRGGLCAYSYRDRTEAFRALAACYASFHELEKLGLISGELRVDHTNG